MRQGASEGLGLGQSLKLNISKSNLYGVSVSEAELQSMAQLTGYQAEADFDGKGCYMHGIWVNIVCSSNYLHSRKLIPNDTLKCQIDCNSSIRFWKDLWLGDEPLCSRFNRLYRLDLNENCTICDRVVVAFRSSRLSKYYILSFAIALLR
nr:RNA-directed DNA polymerase, eukaryota [Tanacetum cinerariifolium]